MKLQSSKHVPFTPAVRALTLLAALAYLCSLQPQVSASPLGTAFSYQGRLADGGNPANGIFDFRFSIWGAGAARSGTR